MGTGTKTTDTVTQHVPALDLFSIGIGPSSSHTVGPMRAATAFAHELMSGRLLEKVARLRITLYGSIAATGVGHGTLGALVAGLLGEDPALCDPAFVATAWQSALDRGQLAILRKSSVAISADDLIYKPFTRLPAHPNAIRFEALGAKSSAGGSEAPVLLDAIYYSVGGGFIERDGSPTETPAHAQGHTPSPFPYRSAVELLDFCAETGLDIAGIAFANETATASAEEVNARLDSIWAAMRECVDAGMAAEGVLPGWLKVPRRAAGIAAHLRAREASGNSDTAMEWLQCFAIAVNEQNAAGARVVTAPTNGAAGIIPAVGYYALTFRGMTEPKHWRRYLLTAGAIGALCKMNASISGADAGCQGEVGSACSMAAAGLTAFLGGTPQQVENAAEVAMEHHLGLTCDPIGGFVQVPCIERNAIAAGTALSATRLAMMGDGTHLVSLDTVIETMRQTGRDMSENYKETSRAGLAVNIVEC
ncbi:MAG: L-serine ammonia-lyase [Microbacteriaceae bacterium]|nr:L-serine ammonia-lyase [Microbacteriaceae bacterium]